MPSSDVIEVLGEWEGYRVGFVKRHPPGPDGSPAVLWVELIRRNGPMVCSGCGGNCDRYHDGEERWIRDLPILDAQTHLLIQRFRVACPKCGPQLEHLPWLDKYARVTKRLADSVARWFRVLPVKHVAEFYGLGWDAVNGAYEAEMEEPCPRAQIVYDPFPVAAKYGREVIDAVRTSEAKRQTNRGERQGIQGSRWLLLRNADGLPRQDRVRLREWSAVNRRLATVYVLKDDLKGLWDYPLPNWARRFFREGYARVIRGRIQPLQHFARALRERIDGILAHCQYPLHTSLLEGIMNKIKVIKRMAYGFRDDDYFFLKIRAAFPGNPG